MATAAWRRGREAPMQWEFTSRSEIDTPNDGAMDISLQDETMRDVSMVAPEHDDGKVPPSTAAASAKDNAIEEIPRPSPSPPASKSSSTALVRPHKSAIRRRRSSSASSSSSLPRRVSSVTHWSLAPVVGTVINYLVPPVATPSEHPSSSSSGGAPATASNATPADERIRSAKATLHPRERPLLLLSYAQLAFNASLLFIVLYIVFALVWTIRLDVVERLREVEDAYHHGVSACQRSLDLNCLSIPIPPALQTACSEWERCSQRKFKDVLGGSRLRVVIEIISEAWEAGVAGLGWRTLAFSLLLLTVFVSGANSTLNSWRLGIIRRSKAQKGSKCHRDDSDDSDNEETGPRPHRAAPHSIVPATAASHGPLPLPYAGSPVIYNHDPRQQQQQQQQQYAAMLAANQHERHLHPSMYQQHQQHYAYPASPSSRRSRAGHLSAKGAKKANASKASSSRGALHSGGLNANTATEWVDDEDGDEQFDRDVVTD